MKGFKTEPSEIGVQFVGTKTALSSTQVAGVVQQDNWNTFSASATGTALNDDTGTATTATLTFSPNQSYFGGNLNDGVPGDAILTSGEIYNGWPNSGSGAYQGTSITVSNIPYARYDVYVYADTDTSNRLQTVELTPTGGSASYQSYNLDNALTTWTISNNTWNGSGTAPTLANANYSEFTGITPNGFKLLFGAPGNGAINGIQIVQASAVPEPATLGLMVLAGVGILLAKRRHTKQA